MRDNSIDLHARARHTKTGNSSDIARLAMMVLVFVMVIYYMLEELDLCRATGMYIQKLKPNPSNGDLAKNDSLTSNFPLHNP